MPSLNSVQIIGNLTRDPELRYTGNGTAVASFTVAVNRRTKSADGEAREQTEFVPVVAWQKLAETCGQILQKGRLVYVEGRLQSSSWEGQDGQKKYKTEVIANTMQVLDKRPAAESGDAFPPDDFADDMPF